MSKITALEQLKEMEREAGDIDSRRSYLEKSSQRLAEIRNSSVRSFPEWLGLIIGSWRYGADEIARDALFKVLDECKHDLVRLAELRLDAEARENKIKAAQKRAVITASIIGVDK